MSLTWVTARGSKVNIPLLYRHILRRAKQFPSVKRDAIVDEIRATFREHKTESDPVEIQAHIDNAVNGLVYLQQYTSFDKGNPNWKLALIGNPIQDPNAPLPTLNALIAGGQAQELELIAPPDEEYLRLHATEDPTASQHLLEDALDSGTSSFRGSKEISFADLMGGPNPNQSQGDDLANAAASVSAAIKRKKRGTKPPRRNDSESSK